MFDGIKDKFKHKSGLKFLRQELNKPFPSVERSQGISAIACLVDLDVFDNANLFYEFVEEFSLDYLMLLMRKI